MEFLSGTVQIFFFHLQIIREADSHSQGQPPTSTKDSFSLRLTHFSVPTGILSLITILFPLNSLSGIVFLSSAVMIGRRGGGRAVGVSEYKERLRASIQSRIVGTDFAGDKSRSVVEFRFWGNKGRDVRS